MNRWPYILGAAGMFYLVYRITRNKMNLTPNFTIWEFQSKDGAPFPLEVLKNLKKLAENLEVIRAEIGRPITITSGYRSPEHNKAIGGAKFSEHITGRAADIKANGITTTELKKTIERLISEGKISEGGIGFYPTWIHYDIRGTKARW